MRLFAQEAMINDTAMMIQNGANVMCASAKSAMRKAISPFSAASFVFASPHTINAHATAKMETVMARLEKESHVR